MSLVDDLVSPCRPRLLLWRSALCLSLLLGVASCTSEEDPSSGGSDGVGADDDSADDDSADDDTGDDDTGDDDTADDDGADDDEEAPDVDAGSKRDGGATMARDAGKLDSGSPTTKSDAAVADASDSSTRDAGEDASTALDAAVDAKVPPEDAAIPSGELCELKPHQVGIMGDSYIDLSDDFTRLLQENARKAGALGPRENYIVRARTGAAMEDSLIKLAPPIPTQLPQVLSDSKQIGPEGVKLIIMTGGGNDVLINHMECRRLTAVTEACKAVVENSLMIMKRLFSDMKKGGIREVIYFWYPDLGIQTGKVINDYSIPFIKEACEGNTDVRCHFVDTRDAFRGHPEWIEADTIHPKEPGSKAIADLVWGVMVDQCLASK